ncbi:hypothetical protein BLNAU_17737 [Blattamonas nauphoetae]|uniref:Uncharacterized protein n=1 Tax=Blattamonas nauphoetae TaxID=2049346 RepID=A0ABQ9XAV7_9EUKA|nr:hypothetical protein BLNAU_17737 [Blattamonas nauphoetae]
MECSPFVVCWMEETDWNSITVTLSSHVSSCSPSLLPLVEISDDLIRSDRTASLEQLDQNDRTSRTDGWTPSVSITGSSIEFCDGDLVLGTGPLIGSLDRIGNDVVTKSVSTSLVGCVLVNMTSRSELEGIEVGSWFGQSIVGSVVYLCSNHLYGTSIRSLNGGGSLLSLNSSFVSCLATQKYKNKQFTANTVMSDNHSFKFCTFKNCRGTYNSGGAITHHNELNVDLLVESCSFDSCWAHFDGGAIHLQRYSGSSNKAEFKSSVFTSSSSQYDATMRLLTPGILTMSKCVFVNSVAQNYGGALGLNSWDPATKGGAISNCLFQNCKTPGVGGAMCLQWCPSVRFSSLLFVDCNAESETGRIMNIYSYVVPTLDSKSVSNCASYSKHFSSLIYVEDTRRDLGEVLSIFPTRITFISLTAEVTGTTADVKVTLDTEVSGTLLVDVSNVGGTRQEVTNGVPNIGRVLEFSMSSSSIGSCSVSIGETGTLQTPLSDYSIISAFLPGYIISLPTSPIFQVPKLPPTLNSAVCSLDASHTKGIVRFEATDFEDGEYEVSLQDGPSFVVEFNEESEGISTGSKDLGVIGSDPKWIEGRTWIVKDMKSVTDTKLSINIALPVSFKIPTVARLSKIEVSEVDISSEGEWKVKLSFSSVELEKGTEYTLTLIGQDSAQETLTREVTTSASGDLEAKEEVLYPFATEQAKREQMKFGVLYKVTSLQATGRSNSVQVGSVEVQMPVEPVRLTQIEVQDKTVTSIRLVVTGSGFVVRETYTVEVSGVLTGSGSSTAHTRTFTVIGSGATSASSSTLVLSDDDSASLQFEQTYTVTKIDNGTDSGIIVGTPSFSTPDVQLLPPLTPSTPRITNTSVELNSQGILFSIVLSGEHLPSDSTFDLTLNDTITIAVSFSSSTKGRSEVVMLGLDGGLDFGKIYSITDLSNGESEIIADGIQISTPP